MRVLYTLALAFGLECAIADTAMADAGTPEPQIPFKQSSASAEVQLTRVGGALVIALAIGILLIVGSKNLFVGKAGAGRSTRIRSIESRKLGVRLTAHLIEVDGTDYLVLHSGDQIQVVRHEPPKVPAEAAGSTNGISS